MYVGRKRKGHTNICHDCAKVCFEADGDIDNFDTDVDAAERGSIRQSWEARNGRQSGDAWGAGDIRRSRDVGSSRGCDLVTSVEVDRVSVGDSMKGVSTGDDIAREDIRSREGKDCRERGEDSDESKGEHVC